MPHLESLIASGAVLSHLEPMAPQTKVVPNRPEGGQEALRMPGGFEAWYDLFMLARGLVGVFCVVVQRAALAMFGAWHHLSLRRPSLASLSVISTRGTYVQPFTQEVPGFRENFFAAALLRRLWTRLSTSSYLDQRPATDRSQE